MVAEPDSLQVMDQPYRVAALIELLPLLNKTLSSRCSVLKCLINARSGKTRMCILLQYDAPQQSFKQSSGLTLDKS